MIENLPNSINVLFLATVFLTLFLFQLSNRDSKNTTLFLFVWGVFQVGVALTGFYNDAESFPPHFLLAIVPPFLLIGIVVYGKLKLSISRFNYLPISTLLHFLRLPVELILLYLFKYGMIPELMTFEGRNFDILAGITAPFVSWLHMKNRINNHTLLYWNIICLILVLFVLVNGILSARLPIQLLAFDQPTIGFEFAPFVLLPSLIVPIVVYTHLVDIIKLFKLIKKK